MNRVLTSLLLALFGFSPFSPLLLGGAVSNLPACCRRAGLHHCLEAGGPGAPVGPAFGAARCPNFPGVQAAPVAAKLAGVVKTSPAAFTPIASHPCGHARTTALYRISYSRAGQKRGPPLFLS